MRYLKTSVSLVMATAFLSNCKTSDRAGRSVDGPDSIVMDEDGTTEDNGPNPNDRSKDIYSSVVSHLEKTNAETKGSLWMEGKGKLEKNWIVQSPESYWGKSRAELPKGIVCDTKDSNCDREFTRTLCETNDQCSVAGTSCETLTSSARPGVASRKMCIGPADRVLDRYYNLMITAEKYLDITTLSNPTGEFYPMMMNALAVLAAKPTPPFVRLIVSGEKETAINAFQDVTSVRNRMRGEIEKLSGKKLPDHFLQYGYAAIGVDLAPSLSLDLASRTPSWNHSKIVIVDQKKMLQGGHNLWGTSYLHDEPVFDLSMEVSGPIVKATQGYVDYLWKHITYPAPKNLIANPSLPGDGAGEVPMIGVGRVQRFGKPLFGNAKGLNPGDDAINALIRSSNRNLKFAIQDFFQSVSGISQYFGPFKNNSFVQNFIIPKLTTGKPWVADALAEAVMKGVKLQVVQSDHNPAIGNYVMLPPQQTFPMLVSLIEEKARSLPAPNLNGRSLRQYICDQIEYAPWRFKAGSKEFQHVGGHSKLVIADDSAFYLGSQNFYPAGLQEYGLIVTDWRSTKQLNDQYWNKLWTASSPEKIPCR